LSKETRVLAEKSNRTGGKSFKQWINCDTQASRQTKQHAANEYNTTAPNSGAEQAPDESRQQSSAVELTRKSIPVSNSEDTFWFLIISKKCSTKLIVS